MQQTETQTTTSTNAASPAPSDAYAGMMERRHQQLAAIYAQDPRAAWIKDGASTIAGQLDSHDPVHGELSIGTSQPIRAPLSIHSAVGGDHDGPNPGDYLCAALAGCFHSTLRVVANRARVVLEDVSVTVNAEVDTRGTLLLADVPVGFQKLTVTLDVRFAPGTAEHMKRAVLSTTERCCVVMQTLVGGVEIEVRHE